MANETQGSGGDQGQQGAGSSERQADNQPVMGEFAPFVDDPSLPSADTDLIMSTLFGGGADQADQGAQGAQGSGGDQSGQGSNAQSGGQSSGGKSGAAAPSSDVSGQGGQAGAGQQGQQGQAAQGAGAAEELPPFSGPGNQGQQASGAQQQSQSQPQGQGQGGQPSGQASASGAAADDGLSPEARLRLHTLETTNAALTQQVQQLMQRQPTQQGSQGAGTQSGQQSGGGGQDGGNADPATQAINLTVPPDLAQGLVDGEGNISLPHLQHFASAIATVAYQRAVQAATTLIDSRFTQYSSSQQNQTEGERLNAAYYGRFKDHDREIFHPLVADESRQMISANPQLVWNDDALNALGARVNTKLQGLGFQIGMQQQGQGGQGQGQGGDQQQGQERGPVSQGSQGNGQLGNGAARPVIMLDSGTRPPQDRAADAGNFIRNTLG